MNIQRQIKNNKTIKPDNEVIKPLLDITTLDFYCRYIISSNKNIRISWLNIIKELFDRIDISSYGNDIDRINRIKFVWKRAESHE